MRILQSRTNIDFVGKRWMFFAFSGFMILGSAVSVATKGLVYGIDFTGGTVLQVTMAKPITLGELREKVEESGIPDASIQSYSGTNTFSIRIKADAANSAGAMEAMKVSIQKALGDNAMRVDSQEYVGPTVGKHLFRQAMWAVILSLTGIVIYIAFQFSDPVWGLAGVIALGHDVFTTVGLFSIAGSEVDLLIISALLTIAGYSINDTIVIFDRMREKMRTARTLPMDQLINESINECLSRTIITNGLVFVAVVILFLFGGKVIHNFAMAMVWGAIAGTYSTIAIATPMVYEWQVRTRRRPQAAPAKPLNISSKAPQKKPGTRPA